jgi:hypothetical protein
MWFRVHIHKPKTASPLSKKVLQVIVWLYVVPGAYTQTKDSKPSHTGEEEVMSGEYQTGMSMVLT